MFNITLSRVVSLLVVLLVSFPLHELAHALLADYLGDDTPRLYGRLSLNPLNHLDLFGSLTLILFGFGWAKPVPVNQDALERRSRYGPALVAVAGPVANLFLAVLGGLLLSTGLFPAPIISSRYIPTIYELLYIFALINFVLFFFNLIPLFPLDGEKIAINLLPYEWSVRLESLRRYTFGPLIVLVWLLPALRIPVISWLVFSPSYWLMSLFVG
jgi:Zn-dependent protease